MRTGLCTPVPERETPVLQSKPNDFEGNFTLKKTPLNPLSIVKAATYDGQSSWRDYRAHFETCAEIKQWDYKDKGLHLAVSLRGKAQGVLGNLAHNSKDYDSLLQALGRTFGAS
ncbi:hypothetical protein DPMN_012528 [Dreissena polymorpha]|uniref:Uncharacterized protein n=1 Tax=Dreissena polymorpha TaxID=45954 RepID=A0A9D4N863_DREPO|nr:hypothetical protein DPMN_012528 [Dreissena polymorpha]